MLLNSIFTKNELLNLKVFFIELLRLKFSDVIYIKQLIIVKQKMSETTKLNIILYEKEENTPLNNRLNILTIILYHFKISKRFS